MIKVSEQHHEILRQKNVEFCKNKSHLHILNLQSAVHQILHLERLMLRDWWLYMRLYTGKNLDPAKKMCCCGSSKTTNKIMSANFLCVEKNNIQTTYNQYLHDFWCELKQLYSKFVSPVLDKTLAQSVRFPDCQSTGKYYCYTMAHDIHYKPARERIKNKLC